MGLVDIFIIIGRWSDCVSGPALRWVLRCACLFVSAMSDFRVVFAVIHSSVGERANVLAFVCVERHVKPRKRKYFGVDQGMFH